MSSGTNETIQMNGGVSSVTDMPFNQGIQSVDDYQKYLALLQNTSEFRPNLFEPLFKTLDSDVLNNIGESQEFGKVMKQLLDIGFNTWNEAMIKSLLKILDYLPFDLDVLIKNSLGFGVKNIKKIAIEKNAMDIVESTNVLIEKWKGLQKKSGLNANGKRYSPERSSSASPPSSTELPVKKQIKLAIQKEPPTRPKAMADPNFLSFLRANTRPIYNVDRILEGFGNKPGKSSTNSIVDSSLSSLKRTENDLVDSPAKKRVRFKDELFEIREYEKNPEEWTSFDTNGQNVQHRYGNARDLDVKEGQNAFMHFPQIAWYTPLELQFDLDNPNSNLNVRSLTQSNEALAQDDREKLALAAIYTSPQHIPASPAEPDEQPAFISNDNSVPVIPLDDTESLPLPDVNTSSSYSSTPPPQPSHSSFSSATLQPNYMTAVNSNAMQEKPTFLVSQQPENHYTQSANSYSQSANSYSQSANNYTQPAMHTASSSMNYDGQSFNAPPTTLQAAPPATPPAAHSGLVGQAAISSQIVDAMLKNNPGIMNSLKQLSFLAGAPQNVQAQPQPAYQPPQPYHPYQQQRSTNQQPQHNECNHTNNMNLTQNRRKRVRARGAKRNMRGGGASNVPGRSSNNRVPLVCNFFNTPEGCRRRETCTFRHPE